MSRLHTLLFTGVLLASTESVADSSKDPSMYKDIKGWVDSAVNGDEIKPTNYMVLRSSEMQKADELQNIFKFQEAPKKMSVASSVTAAAKPKKLTFLGRVQKEASQAFEFAKEKVTKFMNEKGLGSKEAYQAHKKTMKKKTKLEKLSSELPSYDLGGQKTVGNDILKIQKSLTHSRFSGSQPGKRIPLSSSDKVVSVVINPEKIEDIDLDKEPIVPRIELPVGKLYIPSNGYELAKRLRSPQAFSDEKITAMQQKMDATVQPEAVARQEVKVPQSVTSEKIQAVAVKGEAKENEYQDSGFYEYTKEELDFLAAQLIRDNGSCHITTGLFDRLNKVKTLKPSVQLEVAKCSYQMGLYRLAVESASRSIKAEETQKESLALLLREYPKSFEVHIAKAIKNLTVPKEFKSKQVAKYHYQLAKYHFKKRQFKKSLESAKLIPAGTEDFNEGQFLLAVNQEILGQEQTAIKTLTALQKRLKAKNSKNKDLKIVTGINLSRIHYQRQEFGKAYQAQLGINKNHNLWIRAMIEQGWIQISANDFSGAIGNMYSIQSPYFKSVYKPESYAIRAIGYLSICQYGDAYSSLSILEKDYRPWLGKMRSYRKAHKSSMDYYKTIAKYLRSKSSSTTDGLPPQVTRELASQKRFLNIQSGINERYDELEQWKFLKGMIAKDIRKLRWYRSKAKQRANKLRANIAKAKVTKSLKKNLPEWRGSLNSEVRLIETLTFKLKKYEQGKKQFAVMERQEKRRVAKEVKSLRRESGKFLKNHLTEMIATLNRVLDNNEFLRFEIFSGSGENIRYRVSGGEVTKTKRIPAHIKPKKHVSWNFDGEYWEDEIGSYRSNLTNNCPKQVKYINTMNQ